jgi:ABC-type spermidine/putrescine transport system permease subunit II
VLILEAKEKNLSDNEILVWILIFLLLPLIGLLIYGLTTGSRSSSHIHCPNCGKSLQESSIVCPYCKQEIRKTNP